MADIRKASLNSHAAAREVGEDSPARSAARACGQAVATAHVLRHAYVVLPFMPNRLSIEPQTPLMPMLP